MTSQSHLRDLYDLEMLWTDGLIEAQGSLTVLAPSGHSSYPPESSYTMSLRYPEAFASHRGNWRADSMIDTFEIIIEPS